MNLFRTDFLWHAWVVHACLSEFGAEASVDVRDFSLEVRARNRAYRFYPQFTVMSEARQWQYEQRPGPRMRGFAGWLPYFNKRWPIGSGKFQFKDFCAEQGLPTPRSWRAPAPDMRDFLVKLDKQAFGRGMRGPFRSLQAAGAPQALGEGAYYEQFIRGRSLKAWFWEDKLASLEEEEMPMVTGNGRSSVRELMQPQARTTSVAIDWDRGEDLARFQGVTLDTVLPEGQSVLADISFMSPLRPPRVQIDSSLERYKDWPVLDKLRKLGPVLWQGIPETLRPATIYTLDALADENDGVWLLEMNCNPAIHPEAYPLMFETLFGLRITAGTQEVVVAPAPPPPGALPLPHFVQAPQQAPMQIIPPGASRLRWLS
jgi:hypothetical protein